MDIVVLAGGLSTERDVSFVTGNMVSKALRKNGHRVILLDVFMGYSDKKEDISDIFEHTEEVSVQVEDIPTVAPDLSGSKRHPEQTSPIIFSGRMLLKSVRRQMWYLWHFMERMEKTVRYRQLLICLASVIREPAI